MRKQGSVPPLSYNEHFLTPWHFVGVLLNMDAKLRQGMEGNPNIKNKLKPLALCSIQHSCEYDSVKRCFYEKGSLGAKALRLPHADN